MSSYSPPFQGTDLNDFTSHRSSIISLFEEKVNLSKYAPQHSLLKSKNVLIIIDAVN